MVWFLKTVPLDLKFGTETEFDIGNSKIKGKSEIDTYLINYAWYVKTSSLDLEFGPAVTWGAENAI
jgi:hypothetical protein